MKLIRRIKGFILVSIVILVVMLIFSTNRFIFDIIRTDLKGYILGGIFLLMAYLITTRKILILSAGYPEEKIKNKNLVIRFEKLFFTILGITAVIVQLLMNNTLNQLHLYFFAIYLLIGILSIIYVFLRIEEQ